MSIRAPMARRPVLKPNTGGGAPKNAMLSAEMMTESARPGAIAKIRRALKLSKGNKEAAADLLNVGRTTLFRWIKQYPQIMEDA